jgi:hypothetical protein
VKGSPQGVRPEAREGTIPSLPQDERMIHDWTGVLVLLIVIVAFAAVVYFVVRNFVHLVINSIVGLLARLAVNFFHLMQYAGKPDIAVDWIAVIICALGGLPAAVLVVVLALFGVTL